MYTYIHTYPYIYEKEIVSLKENKEGWVTWKGSEGEMGRGNEL